MRLQVCGALMIGAALASSLQADPVESPPAEPAPPPRVVLLRGSLGVFSRGLDSLAARCRQEGMTVSVYPYTSWAALAEQLAGEGSDGKRPLVLIGHSFGADSALALASRLEQHNVAVDLLVTLETVNPARVPDNVARTLNLYSGKTAFSRVPLWRGLPLGPNSKIVENINLRERPDVAPPGTGHGTIDDSPEVHQFVLEQIRNAQQPTSDVAATPVAPSTVSRSPVPESSTIDVPAATATAGEPLQISGPAPEDDNSQPVLREGAFSPTAVAPHLAAFSGTAPFVSTSPAPQAGVPGRPTSRTPRD
jgi:Thioesterase domain